MYLLQQIYDMVVDLQTKLDQVQTGERRPMCYIEAIAHLFHADALTQSIAKRTAGDSRSSKKLLVTHLRHVVKAVQERTVLLLVDQEFAVQVLKETCEAARYESRACTK